MLIDAHAHLDHYGDALARLHSTVPAAMAKTVRVNFLRLIENDPWLSSVRPLLDE